MSTRIARPAMPDAFYRVNELQQLDRDAMRSEGLADDGLMLRAGQALFDEIRRHFADARTWLLLAGLGNNAGDAFVLARLGHEVGIAVQIIQVGAPDTLKGPALTQFRAAEAAGVPISYYQSGPLPDADLIVDGLFGIGLDREAKGLWREAIEAINSHPAPVLAIDIPSGIMTDTGAVMGQAVRASRTLTFIGLKPGLCTGAGPDYCGVISYASLDVPARIFNSVEQAARRLALYRLRDWIPKRSPCAHKGDCGHVLLLGGAPGYLGALLMAGEAALRVGAGLVTLATHPFHAGLAALYRPELMGHGVASAQGLAPLLERASVLVIGPGFGQDDWSQGLFDACLDSDKPLVLDADGLNLLAKAPRFLPQAIITPHPGEAGRLLGCSSAEVQSDRFAALESLMQKYAPVVVLKGPGTLVGAQGDQSPGLCTQGNPGMASGGMGDVLSGIIGGLLAQGMQPIDAAELGVVLHAAAADEAVKITGVHGLLATDLIKALPGLMCEEDAVED